MPQHDTLPVIDPRDAEQRAGTVTFLDVREPEEWAAGHIPEAIHIPLDQLERRHAELPTDKPIITICRSGRRSEQAARFLLERGMDAINLDGGTLAWHAQQLPLEPSDGRVA